MSAINYDLNKIKAFVFDIDGVLSPNVINMNVSGEPVRMLSVKDRYALNRAIYKGYKIAIITGANTYAVRTYYSQLGIKHLYMQSENKLDDFQDFLNETSLQLDEIVYAGDDMPDLEIMKRVGLSVAPSDAVGEILNVAKYVSRCKGGEGIARDVIEQVLKTQDKWI